MRPALIRGAWIRVVLLMLVAAACGAPQPSADPTPLMITLPVVALAIGGMISWAYTWHRPEGRLGLDEMCERMADLTLQMVGVHTWVSA